MKTTLYSILLILAVALLYILVIAKPFAPDYKIVQKIDFNHSSNIIGIKTMVYDNGKTLYIYLSEREISGGDMFNTEIVDSIKTYEYEKATRLVSTLRKIDAYNKRKKDK